MPKHILLSNELEDKGKIIAIHCALELFDLAYKINSSLNLRLYRCDLDISFKKKFRRIPKSQMKPACAAPPILGILRRSASVRLYLDFSFSCGGVLSLLCIREQKSYRKFNALDKSPLYLLLPMNTQIGWVNG